MTTAINKATQTWNTINNNFAYLDGRIDDIGGGASYSATCPAITPVDGVATWNVTHNLGTQAVVTALYSNGNKVEHNTLVTSNNAITVTFKASSAVTAGDYKIVVLASGGSGGGGSADDTYTSNVTNVEIIGSLTNNQGILSNFSSSNYATLPSNFTPSANPWEIVINFHTPSSFNEYPNYLCSALQDPCIAFYINTNRVLEFSIGRGSGWIFNDITGTTILATNTEYWAKLEFTGTQYKSYLSTDGVTYTQEGIHNSNENVPSYPLNLGVSRDLWDAVVMKGSINLNGCYININGSRWWTGADYSELTGLSPVTDYYVSGSSWYKETFSDATRTKRIWLEQGGVASSSTATINLLKNFSNTNYVVTGGASNKTTSSFTLTSNANWVAIGV